MALRSGMTAIVAAFAGVATFTGLSIDKAGTGYTLRATTPGLTVTDTTRESRAIHEEKGAKIIIAGAGMSTGGRIRAHEKELLDDPSTTLLFSGYQAPGGLGRRLQEGAKKVRIDDTWVPH